MTPDSIPPHTPIPQPSGERIAMLRHMIDGAQKELSHHKTRVRSLEVELKTYADELETLETNEFLAAHNAMHLQKGVKLAVCEAFYILQEERGTSRRRIDMMYGRGLTLGSMSDGEFRVWEVNGGTTCGAIPLDVIQAMYEAAQNG